MLRILYIMSSYSLLKQISIKIKWKVPFSVALTTVQVFSNHVVFGHFIGEHRRRDIVMKGLSCGSARYLCQDLHSATCLRATLSSSHHSFSEWIILPPLIFWMLSACPEPFISSKQQITSSLGLALLLSLFWFQMCLPSLCATPVLCMGRLTLASFKGYSSQRSRLPDCSLWFCRD